MSALRILPGSPTVCPAGATYGPASYSGLKGASVQGGAFVGTPHNSNSNQIHFQDCEVAIRGASFRDFWRALRPVGGSFTAEDCTFDNNAQPMMIGACQPCVIRRCVGTHGNSDLMASDDDHSGDPTANHFLYVSFDCHNAVIEDCEGSDHTGCGLHLNGNDGSDPGSRRGPQRGVTMKQIRLFRCGSGGTHAFQPDNNVDATVEDLLIADPPVGPLAFYHNGMGAQYACKRWALTRCTLWMPDARTNIHVSDGTEQIEFRDSVFVLADDRLVADAESGGDPPYLPSFANCVFYVHNADHVPSEARPGNTIRDIADAPALFPRASAGDFTPSDPGVPGWRPAGAPMPPTPPPPVPVPPPPPDPLAADLAEMDGLIERVQTRGIRAKQRVVQSRIKAEIAGKTG